MEGTDVTVVTWGAMVERCESAAKESAASVEILDLRTLCPWDHEAVLQSVEKTRRCIIVHEDTHTAGFGAEVSAHLAEHAFFNLDAPIQRVTVPDVPIPYNVGLMNEVVPNASSIKRKIEEVLEI